VIVRVGATDGSFTEVLDGEIEPGSPIILDLVTAS
jgi:hypothetical protein